MAKASLKRFEEKENMKWLRGMRVGMDQGTSLSLLFNIKGSLEVSSMN